MTVRYHGDGQVATITMDDGKVNAMSPAMISGVDAALDRAAAEGAVVVLEGRAGVFSAGFDLTVLRAGGPSAGQMVRAGFELAERILSFPAPVVMACPGHAFAMGAFLLLAADHRIGADGEFTIATNEVAIGLTMPRTAVELLRFRLTPAAVQQAGVLAEPLTPRAAAGAGFLDAVVEPDRVGEVAQEVAVRFAKLDRPALIATKLRIRAATIEALRRAFVADGEAT